MVEMVFAKADPRVSLLYEEHLCVPELHQFGDILRTCEPRPPPIHHFSAPRLCSCPPHVRGGLTEAQPATPMQRLRILVKGLAEY